MTDSRPPESRPEPTRSSERRGADRRRRILVLDDSEFVREATSMILEDGGYDAVTLDSPFGLHDALCREDPALVLIDVGMPGLSGDRLAELTRRAPTNVREIARELHTLKGESNMLGLPAIAVALHAAETLLAGAGGEPPSPPVCELLARALEDVGRALQEGGATSGAALEANRASIGTGLRRIAEDFDRCSSLLDDLTDAAWSLRLSPVEPALLELVRHARARAPAGTLTVPATVSWESALVVEVGGALYGIAMRHIVELIRVADHTTDGMGPEPRLRYRGAAIPLRSLSTALDAVSTGDEARAVLVETPEGLVAFTVPKVLGDPLARPAASRRGRRGRADHPGNALARALGRRARGEDRSGRTSCAGAD